MRPRAEDRKNWPAGLREPREGYYTYRSPITGREVGLGRVKLEDAIRQAREHNQHVKHVRGSERQVRQGTVHGVRDRRGLLEPEHVAANAMLYDCVCGIYFLLLNDEVVYVGQSTDVLRRFSQHRQEGTKEFNRVYIVQCQPVELERLEAMYIDKYRPKHNATIPPVDPKTVVWRGTFSTILAAD